MIRCRPGRRCPDGSTSTPRRCRAMYDFGEVVFEAEPFAPTGRAARVEGLAEELVALHNIFMVNERAVPTVRTSAMPLSRSPLSAAILSGLGLRAGVAGSGGVVVEVDQPLVAGPEDVVVGNGGAGGVAAQRD